jgi:transglutaminase-like putative cysteine protease
VIYRVHHRTTYAYDAPVAFTQCVLRLTPQSSARQTVLDHRVTVTPKPAQTQRRAGPFDESQTAIVVEAPHSKLVIDAASRVDVHAPSLRNPEESPAWEIVRDRAFETGALGVASPATYLYPTVRTPIAAPITDYARESFAAGRPVVAAAGELMRRIRADFAYESGSTSIATPSIEAFEARHGVCQDFANIMIGALRGLGLPAAYVSGYLRTTPPPGKPRLEGADATHAWVQLWCGPSLGWIGLDPTNALFALDDHIILAVGRDYGDVAPIEGVMLASGAQTLKVEVDVKPEPEAAVLRPAFGASA